MFGVPAAMVSVVGVSPNTTSPDEERETSPSCERRCRGGGDSGRAGGGDSEIGDSLASAEGATLSPSILFRLSVVRLASHWNGENHKNTKESTRSEKARKRNANSKQEQWRKRKR